MMSLQDKKWMKRCVLLFLAGTALQFLVGRWNVSFLSYPWNIVLAVNYLYLLICLYTNADKWKWVKPLYDRSACVASLASMLFMTLIFGLVRQDGTSDGWVGMLGYSQMTSCWTFLLFLFLLMTVMGLKVIDDVWQWKSRRLSTVVLHTAFFVILVAAAFGSGDKVRIRVGTVIGQPVHEGFTAAGKRVELPFVLTLKDFSLDEYPPRLHIVNQGKLSKHFVEIEGEGSKGDIGPWQVECLDYLDMAGRLHEDSAYVSMKHVGATTAVSIKATHKDTQETVMGWVSCGSHIFSGNAVDLPDGSFIVMPQREVKKYLSVVEVMEENEKEQVEIAVNHPADIGSWKIYQSGYDSSRGRWSTTSVLECVKDAWYVPIQIALWLILAAGAWMIGYGWKASKKRKEDKI